jgi:hypothetical protein
LTTSQCSCSVPLYVAHHFDFNLPDFYAHACKRGSNLPNI